MSTKTTSRESTWTPRYAWMPVSTRHMRNGAHRIAKSSAIISFEYLRERLDVVVDRRDVVVGALDRTDRIGHDERLGAAAGLGGDTLGELEIVPRLHEDHLNLLGLHLTDYLDEVLRRGRNARTVLEHADLDETEAGEEIDEVRMVDDDLAAAHRLHLLGPAFHLSIELQHHARPHLGFVEVLRPARERVDLDEIAAHRLGERLEVRDRGDDPELAIGVRAGQRQTQQAQDCRDHHECASHESSPPRKDAPGGRRG